MHMSTQAVKSGRLYFVEGTSDKFWEAEYDGEGTITTRYGRNGTAGTESSKAGNLAAYEKLVASKLKKGYHE